MKRLLALPWVLALFAGCGEETIMTASSKTGKSAVAAAPKATTAPSAAVPPRTPIDDSEFAEGDASRDPFRSYADSFVVAAVARTHSNRDVVVRDYSLDELRLIGIVTRVEPKAMLVDPSGKGWVVRRGQFVGRADVVKAGGGAAAYEINWRVDRIREGDVVFVREDPQNRDAPAVTRVVPLRPPDPTLDQQ